MLYKIGYLPKQFKLQIFFFLHGLVAPDTYVQELV